MSAEGTDDRSMKVSKELKSHERFVVLVRPGLITYGLETREARLAELRRRIGGKELARVRRPLYGMVMHSLASREVIRFVQMEATDVYREYWFAELRNGYLLYIEELEAGLQIFMVSGDERAGFEDFSLII